MARQKLILGIGVLCLVDIIWVLSAELSEYIFHESDFNKPFFSTYLKTSIFVIYLFGFAFLRRWRYELRHIRKPATLHQNLLEKITELVSKESSDTKYGTSSKCHPVEDDPAQENNMFFQCLRRIRKKLVIPNRLNQALNEEGYLEMMSGEELEESRLLLSDVCAKVSLKYSVFLSLLFVVLWVVATLMYQYALSKTSATVTNILSSTSGIFTLLLAAIFPSSPSDKFSISKLLATLASFGGVFIICWTDPNRDTPTSFNIGDIYALLGAIFYACYLVLVRRKVGDEGNLDIPLFLGFVGLFGLLVFWPMFFILHYTGVERFELPDKMTWLFLLLNGFIGTALSELLWLWGCFLTSSLMATLALGFVSPMTLVWDLLGITSKKVVFSKLFFVGTAPIIASFVVVSVLTHYGDWDPIGNWLRRCCCSCSNAVTHPVESVVDRNSDGGKGSVTTEQHA